MKDRLREDLKVAMKAGDDLAVQTLRMILAAHKNEEIAKRRDLTAEETTAVLNRAVKSRQDSIEMYVKGGRPESAEKERREIEIVKRYMPQMLSEAETAEAADAVIKELGVTSKKEMGRVMKELMARHPGRVDGRLANQIVASRLA